MTAAEPRPQTLDPETWTLPWLNFGWTLEPGWTPDPGPWVGADRKAEKGWCVSVAVECDPSQSAILCFVTQVKLVI